MDNFEIISDHELLNEKRRRSVLQSVQHNDTVFIIESIGRHDVKINSDYCNAELIDWSAALTLRDLRVVYESVATEGAKRVLMDRLYGSLWPHQSDSEPTPLGFVGSVCTQPTINSEPVNSSGLPRSFFVKVQRLLRRNFS